jgi:DMSO/TMAO reductase YedYZ heme-binding membrane subunit
MNTKAILFFAVVFFFALVVSIISFLVAYVDPVRFSIRLFALNGFIALSISAIMTPFLKEITIYLRKPFLRVHHCFAALGLTLITLHPIFLAIQRLNPAVFLPTVGSFDMFMINGGRQALIIIYIAFVAVILRRKIVSYWRPFHALMYVALFFGIAHANLIGTDFQNIIVLISLNALFVASILAFVLKRWQMHKIRNKQKALAKKTELTN